MTRTLFKSLAAMGALALSANAFAANDLKVKGIEVDKQDDGYHVFVEIAAAGETVGPFYVDLFEGRNFAPEVGEFGDQFKRIDWISGDGESVYVEFMMDVLPDNNWLDAIVDTDGWIDEINENNNHKDHRVP